MWLPFVTQAAPDTEVTDDSGKEADNPGGAQICYLELKFNYVDMSAEVQ